MKHNILNASSVTNLFCILIIVLGHTIVPEAAKPHILGMGYFGFSGAVTNWLAIHMLFERVPGLYGSGIIPLKFESFKQAIHDMIMGQFFTKENISNFMKEGTQNNINLDPIIQSLNYNKIFDGFLDVIQKSKFGGMLAFVGGVNALEPMRDPFAETLKTKLKDISSTEEFSRLLAEGAGDGIHDELQEKIAGMVNHRLEELTPEMVKEIVQNMIRSHLGWLVIWGGVFGGLIGLGTSFVSKF